MNASDFLPAEFNVASWFVDRPVAEGRGRRARVPLRGPRAHLRRRAGARRSHRERAPRAGRRAGAARGHDLPRRARVPRDAFWGAIKIGAVPVPVNTLLRAPDYRYVLDDSRARVAVVSAAAPGRGDAGARGRAASPARAGRRRRARARTSRSRTAIARASATLEAAPTSRDDVAFWLYSSGSTGRPKGAVHLHHDMVVCRRDLREAGARHPADRQGLLRGQALLRLRPRQRRLLPDERRRPERALPAAGRRRTPSSS